jgi:hypothetical protein
MSVINVTQMWSKTGGSFSTENFNAYSAKYQITEAYQVLCEIGDDIKVAVTAVGIPSIGEQHPSGAFAYVKGYNATPMGPTLWVVTVTYEGVPDPAFVTEVVDVEWSDITSTEPIDRDFDGKAIVTVNKEKVEGLTMEIADQTCVIRRRFNSINTYAISAYRHSTNSDTFLGWPAGTARLVGFSAKSQFSYGAPQGGWDVTARIQFRAPLAGATAAQAWYKRWTHEGYYVNIGSVVRRATDAQSVETAKPVLLKADGTQETNPDTPLFKYTKIYGSLPYDALGLV